MRLALPGSVPTDESLLPEIVDERPAALDVGRCSGHDDEELACLGCIRIAEHRCCDITLSVTFMLPREMGRGNRADRTHRKMNGAALQSNAKAEICLSKRDIENGVVVRQHADDDIAVEKIGDIRRWPETKCSELVHAVRPTDIGDDLPSDGGKVCGHCRAHATEADKADFAQFRQAGV